VVCFVKRLNMVLLCVVYFVYLFVLFFSVCCVCAFVFCVFCCFMYVLFFCCSVLCSVAFYSVLFRCVPLDYISFWADICLVAWAHMR